MSKLDRIREEFVDEVARGYLESEPSVLIDKIQAKARILCATLKPQLPPNTLHRGGQEPLSETEREELKRLRRNVEDHRHAIDIVAETLRKERERTAKVAEELRGIGYTLQMFGPSYSPHSEYLMDRVRRLADRLDGKS